MPFMNAVLSSELAAIQSELVAAVCDKVCLIYRKTTSVGTAGEPVDTYGSTPLYTTVAGTAQPTAGQLQLYADLIGSLIAWQVHLPLGTDVQHQDHLVIGADVLEVQVVPSLHSYPGLLTVLASEVK